MPIGRVTDPPHSNGKLQPDEPPRGILWFAVPDADNPLYPEGTIVDFDRPDPGRPDWARNVRNPRQPPAEE